MANTYRFRWGPKILRWIDKTGTTAIEQGDMLRTTIANGKVEAVSASGDASYLMGIAMGASPTTDPSATPVRVALIGYGTVFEMTVASGSHTFGTPFVIGGAQTLVEKAGLVNLSATAANVVAVCAEDLDTAGTKLLVSFLAPTQIGRVIQEA